MFARLALFSVAIFSILIAQVPGAYTGTWNSAANGGSGKLMMTFEGEALGSASFSIQGQEVKTKPISIKKDGGNVEFVFEYTLEGNVLRSRMQGTTSPLGIKGKYKSTTADETTPVDEGTWEVTLKP